MTSPSVSTTVGDSRDERQPSVRVHFDRIGRSRSRGITFEPLIVESTDPDVIAEAIYQFARPHLASRDVGVVVNMDDLRGGIFCGSGNGGTFVLEHVSAVTE